jgi:hypothetical protein
MYLGVGVVDHQLLYSVRVIQGYFFSNPPFETKRTTTTNALGSEKE